MPKVSDVKVALVRFISVGWVLFVFVLTQTTRMCHFHFVIVLTHAIIYKKSFKSNNIWHGLKSVEECGNVHIYNFFVPLPAARGKKN